MDIFQYDPGQVLSFLLTLFRISIVLFLLPFFGGNSLPKPAKAALCIILALVLFPTHQFSPEYFPSHPINIAIMLLGELVLGLTMGLMVQFIFAAIQTGGQLIGFQMGFAMVNVVDPMTGSQEAVTAHFLYMVSLLTFLTLNGHLYLLEAVSHSFDVIPPGGLFISAQLVNSVLDFSKQLFVLAVRIAAPVMAALFLIDLALALVGRAAPQMNVLIVGFPLKISVGFFFLAMIFTLISLYMQDFITDMSAMYHNLLRQASQ